ncbi:DUF2789 family protein [Bowmanella sp. Y26]|uniref:DUF2789 domain-containing protein n=1 Tax=Bowmanella yangjiangensis TaxID=2811230 RepID=A0ABS3CWB7_9ALTE|nr:DUF2789 domain-containing protein [Bowmanella yangjiangensis]MBN7821417.1 DUF2789 domain-containing protein [Bowmanella yangjiangensis]MBT1065723.1 DUF2789 family protein [Bowmanella yangjiangensis]
MTLTPSIHDLFEQLGLENTDNGINGFIERHKGLNDKVKLENAPFWNPSQAQFIQRALAEDAEWAEIIDQLNARLR